MPASKKENAFKICVVGNSRVGKSCIAARLVNDIFHVETKSTIGSAFLHKELNVNGEVVNMNIWDTCGQERFRALAPLYFRDASAVILVYDITNESSFESLRTVWVPALRACTKLDLVLAMVGNKLDLEDRGRVVAAEMARGYADILDAIFMETSAKTGANVERVFTELGLKIMEAERSSTKEQKKHGSIRLPGSSTADKEASYPDPPSNSDGNTPGQHRKKSSCKCN